MNAIKRKLGAVLNWFNDRTGLITIIKPIAEHPVPRKAASWWYVFGSATLIAFIIQIGTGLVLASMYVPSPDLAYQSLNYITNDAPFGSVVRGIHNFGATAMIILVGLHVIQVFLFGAFKFPREINWMSGVILLALTLAVAFTGQILRWDGNGVWTTTVLVKMVGRLPVLGEPVARFLLSGDVVNASTLSHFFVYHAFLIPALIIVTVALHLWLVIANGISEPPQAGRPVDPKTYRAWYKDLLKREGVPFWPEAIWKDAVFACIVSAIILALAVLVGPPELGTPPSPAILETNPRPDWYFLWLFSMLAILPPGIEFYVLIGGSLLFFAVAFFLPLLANRGERSARRRPWAVGFVVVGLTFVTAMTLLGAQAPWSPNFGAQPLQASVVGVSSGPVWEGSQLFFDKGCQYCHMIAGDGGQRGPNLTEVGDRLTPEQLTWRIANGGTNMPAFASTLTQDEMTKLVAFLSSRRTPNQIVPSAGDTAAK